MLGPARSILTRIEANGTALFVREEEVRSFEVIKEAGDNVGGHKLESAVPLGAGEVLGTSYGKAWRKVQGMRKEEF